MKQRRRIYYNVEQRNLMWDRWQKCELTAWDRAHRAKTCKLAKNPALALIVAKQKYKDRDQRTHQASAQVTAGTLQVTDLGSRQRDGGSSALQSGHREISHSTDIIPNGCL